MRNEDKIIMIVSGRCLITDFWPVSVKYDSWVIGQYYPTSTATEDESSTHRCCLRKRCFRNLDVESNLQKDG
ncbi:hypothetical protein HanXRQr2_Chr13g0603161 [Helianthus annuus]|uniref:Uncharacterized protein n=1 Tax=Helianthus annuus TaxID=4232 RepID=A0A9K3HDM0_HELAN|nr:hypothetical protein HanXRQr2_Chr13g0603161 [Helianthus annuus]KAJ0850467.1 hypothetical protein HanPSC8_Chr13g0581161 [Helianthus annuus]